MPRCVTLLLVVEDSFRIQGRGTVLAPALDTDRVARAALVTIDAQLPDGTSIAANARIMQEHARLKDGSSRWSWVLVVDDHGPTLPAGTEIHVVSVDPPDALR